MVFMRPDVILDDMSLGWHLLTGNFILNNRAIPHTDLISYTRAGKPWVPYEWLSGLIMAIVVRIADMPGLLIFTAALVAATWMLLYKQCSRVKDNFGAFAFVLTLCGARVAFGLWSARPYTFTYPLVLILVSCLEKFRRGLLPFPVLCLTLSVITVLWTNLHPSFVLGLGIIAVYLISDLLETAFVRTVEQTVPGQSKSKQLFLLLGICSACTLINPFGYSLHTYLLPLSLSWPQQAKLIGESEVYPIFVTGGVTGIGFELLVALGVFALAFTRSKPALCHIILFLLLGHMSFAMARAVPIFLLVNLPFIAEWVAGIPELNLQNIASPVSKVLTWWRRISTDTAGGDRQRRLLPALTVSLLLMIAMVQNSTHAFTLIRAEFNSKKLPTSAARYVIDRHLPEREGFSMYAWGGYLRWVYGIHVFIDDSNEFFDRKAYLTYLRIVKADAGWEQTLADNHISWILCDKRCNLTFALWRHPDWKMACEDPASVLFVRRDRYQLPDTAH
jgi:hypothetical protein